ncbi:hypothetical protein BTH42_32095 [Burkholderia sp. SRS-W-2-2016]|uniref:DUF6519 domain-containing protein n=1 Tax=Burkholderia sp. SRS-W-2-2016 TaxID=1926878 RepID=UPI00094B7558|nr:DUF6519 domain-containing protein [Burkholderia sp. SRS-W-2-2016]OLL27487.1 hypothetical protein BTH42_32095 [Burkholderia sp. SRS-W-2-2016]
MTIRNDATRLRIPMSDPRRPRAVVARQGMALLDTDLDQQSRHQLDRIETETADTLGPPDDLLVPAGNDGFHITPGATAATFKIGAGHGYLDGWLLENPSSCTNGTQPHPRNDDGVVSPAIIGIKALVRYIDSVEDSGLADVALGDAQASGRSLVDWQVFPLAIGGANPVSCATGAADAQWRSLIAGSTGKLTVIEQAAVASTDPCSLTPAGGFNRMENLCYRFEIHDGVPDAAFPDADGPRFQLDKLRIKFSRRNASVLARVTKVSGNEITVGAPPLDQRNWFAPGQYAELVSVHDDVDPRQALKTERLYRVALAADDRVVLEEQSAGDIAAVGADGNGGWLLRLWDAFSDGEGLATVVAAGGAVQSQDIDTGDGLIVKAGLGTFRRGDYWTCAARANGSVDWPKTGATPQAMTPHGPEVRYASIAAMNGAPGAIVLDDCRIPFGMLSDRIPVYRGGDGQNLFTTATAGMVALPGKLRVGVVRGEHPVNGAAVKWSFVGPAGGSCQINGTLCDAANSPQTFTDANGLAQVEWAIDAARHGDSHQVQASLVDAGGLVVPPILFTAAFETAARTAYMPGKCAHLTNVNNVQDALDTLCSKIGAPQKTRVISLRSIVLIDQQKKPIQLIEEDLILNGRSVYERAFVGGIFFGFDTMPDHVEEDQPVAEIELDLPYPATDPDRLYWRAATVPSDAPLAQPFGFQRVRLDGTVSKVDDGQNFGAPGEHGIVWLPSPQARDFLISASSHMFGAFITQAYASQLKDAGWKTGWRPSRVLCRIRLRSAHIWSDTTDGRIYLNAEHLGTSRQATGIELLTNEVDPQRAADLDMFIYLHRG